jgi:branched-chain amino acid aminotransferase
MKVWIDGAIVPGSEARIPVLDHGLLYGDGVFEGIRARSRRVFRLDAHLERLAVSAAAIGLELPGGTPALRAIVLDTLRALGADDAYVRLVVTRGCGPLGVDPTTCSEPRVFCIADQIHVYDEERRRRGLDLVTVSVRRPAPDVLDPRVKSLNYLNPVLAKLEARRRGADEALLLNGAGAIAEASVANVFAVRAGVLRTPPASDGALDGITRESVLRLAGALGIEAREQTLTRIDLLGADEGFLTGTGAGIVPIRSLDGARLRSAPGPLTEKLTAAFEEHARREGVEF